MSLARLEALSGAMQHEQAGVQGFSDTSEQADRAHRFSRALGKGAAQPVLAGTAASGQGTTSAGYA